MPIAFSASDDCSGVGKVSIEYSFNLGEWFGYDAYYGSGESGVIDFVVSPYAEGRFDFRTIAEDVAGNVEGAKSAAEASAWFDKTAPVSFCTAPEFTNQTTIDVDFNASDGANGSGVAETSLWARYSGNEWQDTGLSATSATGAFAYNGAVDGTLQFFTLSTDMASNAEQNKVDADCIITIDTVAPESSCQAPVCADNLPIAIQFVARDARPGSGIHSIKLFYRVDGGEYTEFGYPSFGTQGTIAFSPPGGAEGVYDFYTGAIDRAGNIEPHPDYPPSTTAYDKTPPNIAMQCAEFSSGATVQIAYEASDVHAGLADVRLLYRFGGSDWTDSGLQKTLSEGVFIFSPEADGNYHFGLIAEDACGNASDVEDCVCETFVDRLTPSSSCTCDDYTRSSTVRVHFTSQDSGSGVSSVRLLYMDERDLDWRLSGLTESSADGTFEFEIQSSEGAYRFATIAKDVAGNEESEPYVADDSVIYDGTPPSSYAYSKASVDLLPISVGYSAIDFISGVASVGLYYRYSSPTGKAAGAWRYSGLNSQAPDGTFHFAPQEG